MSQKPSFFEKLNQWVKRSITLRLITITILILLLLIPVNMIESLIREREYRQKDAISEVSAKWGEGQTITGPVLTVPFKVYSKVYDQNNSDKYSIVESTEYAHFLPEELIANGRAIPQMRYRGIYEVIVYNAKVHLVGSFAKPNFDDWKIAKDYVMWDQAFISLGLSDLRSIQKNVDIQLGNKSHPFNPGLISQDVIENGVTARVDLTGFDSTKNLTYAMSLDFNGSSNLNFIPVGKRTEVKLTSNWGDPSFTGAFLPDHRVVSKDSFTATWEVLHLNRPYPQRFLGSTSGIASSSFGVDLIVPVDEYQKSMRSAKYAVIFITLTFLVFFFVQILNAIRIHPIQYIIVGLALCVFYTLLIALSEHIPFKFSYLISSLVIIAMITLYAKSIFKNVKLTRLIGLILLALYVFIFSIIQMEDYALLMGSIGLFLVLATIMYLSRKIDWYAVGDTD